MNTKQLIMCFLLMLFVMISSAQSQVRQIEDFNFDWKFIKGQFAGASDPGYDDSKWLKVRLQHDWDAINAQLQVKKESTVGWYRKSFTMSKTSDGKVTWIEFDGVYNNSEVWINGHSLGKRPYGYTPFSYDLTPYLKYGQISNVISVKVDRNAYMDSSKDTVRKINKFRAACRSHGLSVPRIAVRDTEVRMKWMSHLPQALVDQLSIMTVGLDAAIQQSKIAKKLMIQRSKRCKMIHYWFQAFDSFKDFIK